MQTEDGKGDRGRHVYYICFVSSNKFFPANFQDAVFPVSQYYESLSDHFVGIHSD